MGAGNQGITPQTGSARPSGAGTMGTHCPMEGGATLQAAASEGHVHHIETLGQCTNGCVARRVVRGTKKREIELSGISQSRSPGIRDCKIRLGDGQGFPEIHKTFDFALPAQPYNTCSTTPNLYGMATLASMAAETFRDTTAMKREAGPPSPPALERQPTSIGESMEEATEADVASRSMAPPASVPAKRKGSPVHEVGSECKRAMDMLHDLPSMPHFGVKVMYQRFLPTLPADAMLAATALPLLATGLHYVISEATSMTQHPAYDLRDYSFGPRASVV